MRPNGEYGKAEMVETKHEDARTMTLLLLRSAFLLALSGSEQVYRKNQGGK